MLTKKKGKSLTKMGEFLFGKTFLRSEKEKSEKSEKSEKVKKSTIF